MSYFNTGMSFDHYDAIANIQSNLSRLSEEYIDAGIRATKKYAEKVLELSQEQVPADTGTLSLSAELSSNDTYFEINYHATVRDRFWADVAMGRRKEKSFDNIKNPDFNYAYLQHECMEYNHPYGGKAHFLSDPLEETEDEFIRMLSNEIEATRRAFKPSSPKGVSSHKQKTRGHNLAKARRKTKRRKR